MANVITNQTPSNWGKVARALCHLSFLHLPSCPEWKWKSAQKDSATAPGHSFCHLAKIWPLAFSLPRVAIRSAHRGRGHFRFVWSKWLKLGLSLHFGFQIHASNVVQPCTVVRDHSCTPPPPPSLPPSRCAKKGCVGVWAFHDLSLHIELSRTYLRRSTRGEKRMRITYNGTYPLKK